MTTPFSGGARTPFIIDLLPIQKSVTSPSTEPNAITVDAGGVASLFTAVYADWSKIIGTFYFSAVWGHPSLANSGTTAIQLYNLTNTTALVTFTTTTTNETGPAGDMLLPTSDVVFTTFTKPSSNALISMKLINGESVAKGLIIYNAQIWVL